MENRKIALLHYWLLTMRGGEKFLEQLCQMFPDSDIFTHAAIPNNLSPEINKHRITESFIGHLPVGRRYCQHYLPMMPLALRQWNLSDYDLIISSESGPVKGIRKPPHAKHICYCHTPMRYLWDMFDDYYQNNNIVAKMAMRLTKSYLRNYDLKSAENVDCFIANSNFVAERIKRIYGRESMVIYPPVNVDFFRQAPEVGREYFLCAGQLTAYKRPDLVVEAFSRLDEKLIIAGDGFLLNSLRKKATSNITFTGKVSQNELRSLYAGAKALIFPGVEDFGMIPVEAQAAGCPVIAFAQGGALESVIPEKTGLFFQKQTVNSLLNAIEEFNSCQFSHQDLLNNAARFSTEHFTRKFMEVVNAQMA